MSSRWQRCQIERVTGSLRTLMCGSAPSPTCPHFGHLKTGGRIVPVESNLFKHCVQLIAQLDDCIKRQIPTPLGAQLFNHLRKPHSLCVACGHFATIVLRATKRRLCRFGHPDGGTEPDNEIVPDWRVMQEHPKTHFSVFAHGDSFRLPTICPDRETATANSMPVHGGAPRPVGGRAAAFSA
jgi:hypothetical protein